MIKSTFILVPLMAFMAACSAPEIERTIPSEFLGGERPAPENEFTGWVTMEEAIANGSENNKKILVNVYTDWCGYCRQMDEEVYTKDRVQSALDEHYYAVRINAESSEQVVFNGQSMSMQELAMGLGATGYPTTIFLTEEGEPLGFQPGFIDSGTFERLLVYVGIEAYEDNISFDQFRLD
ncbi:MAG: thioredoxin fold domain-containing protein [Balneolia bacterium]|nr:thioredoxin fold domain-containing protein [Balneolia bacterium]